MMPFHCSHSPVNFNVKDCYFQETVQQVHYVKCVLVYVAIASPLV